MDALAWVALVLALTFVLGLCSLGVQRRRRAGGVMATRGRRRRL